MAISKIIGSGLGTINSPVEFTSADNLTQITLSSTDADAGVGPVLDFYRNSASPADDDDLGFINFYGENDAGEKTLYGQIRASINDASNGTEDTRFIIQTAVGGTQETSRVELTGTETIINQDSKDLDFRVESDNDANAFFVEGDTGNIGMGTNDPTVQDAGMKMLHIHNPATDGTGRSALKLTNGDSGLVASRGGIITLDDSATLTIGSFESAGTIAFTSGGTSTRMKLDASGNFLIGGLDANPTGNHVPGAAIAAGGQASFQRDGGNPLRLGRDASDGNITEFYRQAVEIGAISIVGSNNLSIGGSVANHCGLSFATNAILPMTENATNNNTVEIGANGNRFKQLFVTNGTISTSDETLKQDIAGLTSAEMLVAKRISALFKTFRWKDKVATEGDNARTHTGTIAQDVQAAFSAESLDAGNYSLFTSGLWWENDVDVDAVEANEDDGVIAADAYTRTDYYYIESEAPEGSTRKTRLGIRYNELLSFLAAYNEQRFTSIETRLTALEDA